MTLLLASLGEEMAVLAADAAISTIIEGVTYRVQDDYKKIHVIGETLVFLSGDVNLSEWTISKYKRSKVKGAEELQRIMREEYVKYSAIRPQIAELRDYVGLFGFICQMEAGRIVGYLINSANKFEVERCEAPANNSVTVTAGVNEKIAQCMLTESYAAGVGAIQAYAHIFDTLASEKIGGKADVYLMDRSGIRKIHTHTTKEPQLKRVDRRFVRSAAVLDKQIQALMLDAVITGSHINVGDGTFTVDGATGHMRTTSGEFSGSITASTITGTEINGGTVTGARIRTATNGVYPRVEIDPSNVAFGVYSDANSGIQIPAFDGGVSKIIFNANGNQSVIFNSPTSGFILSGFGRATLSGDGVKLAPGSDYVRVPSWGSMYSEASHTTLQSELDAIWSAISGKANAGHTHSVTVPNHNHGNPANATSGGGTFTAV